MSIQNNVCWMQQISIFAVLQVYLKSIHLKSGLRVQKLHVLKNKYTFFWWKYNFFVVPL